MKMDFWETKLSPMMSITVLLLLIATETYYREPLFEMSIPVIKELQSTATPDSIAFMKLVSEIGAIGLIVGVIVLTYIFSERSRSFYYVSIYA